MSVFVDSSALLALLDQAVEEHPQAKQTFWHLLEAERLITHNYVVVETVALAQRRFGVRAVRALLQEVVPELEVVWVDEATHNAAASALLASTAPRVSFVDRVSFEVMRERRVERAFAFDRDFAGEGFELLP